MARVILSVLAGLLLSGCSRPNSRDLGRATWQEVPLSIQAIGSHAPPDAFSTSHPQARFIVWSENPGVVSVLTTAIQRGGHTVVERARVPSLVEEQRFRLTQTPEREADLLHVGKLLGADDVIFVDVTKERVGRPGHGPLFLTSVAVRAVRVESGEVRWSGTARYSMAISAPDTAVPLLAQVAAVRAICPVEEGYEWHKPVSRWNGSQWEWDVKESGCRKKAPEQIQPPARSLLQRLFGRGAP